MTEEIFKDRYDLLQGVAIGVLEVIREIRIEHIVTIEMQDEDTGAIDSITSKMSTHDYYSTYLLVPCWLQGLKCGMCIPHKLNVEAEEE